MLLLKKGNLDYFYMILEKMKQKYAKQGDTSVGPRKWGKGFLFYNLIGSCQNINRSRIHSEIRKICSKLPPLKNKHIGFLLVTHFPKLSTTFCTSCFLKIMLFLLFAVECQLLLFFRITHNTFWKPVNTLVS